MVALRGVEAAKPVEHGVLAIIPSHPATKLPLSFLFAANWLARMKRTREEELPTLFRPSNDSRSTLARPGLRAHITIPVKAASQQSRTTPAQGYPHSLLPESPSP